jgi:MFS family permease
MDGVAGYAGWRWIFILEGIFTVAVAVAAYWIVPDWPETAKFLKEPERELLIARLALDVEGANMSHWNKKTAKRVFSDVKIYLGSVGYSSDWLHGSANQFSIAMYLGIVTTSYSGSFFTPTILKQLGWTSIHAQVMSIPIFIFATVCALTCAVISDRIHHRFGFIIGGCLLATIGYVILLNMHRVAVGVRYFALFTVVGGGYIAQPVTLVWLNNNVSGHYKRSVSSAMSKSSKPAPLRSNSLSPFSKHY